MDVNRKIRIMREIKNWTQEEMAEKLGMSHNGYAKIERGETKLYLEKLNQIAQIFNIDVRRRQLLHKFTAAFAPPKRRKLYQLLRKFIPV